MTTLQDVTQNLHGKGDRAAAFDLILELLERRVSLNPENEARRQTLTDILRAGRAFKHFKCHYMPDLGSTGLGTIWQQLAHDMPLDEDGDVIINPTPAQRFESARVNHEVYRQGMTALQAKVREFGLVIHFVPTKVNGRALAAITVDGDFLVNGKPVFELATERKVLSARSAVENAVLIDRLLGNKGKTAQRLIEAVTTEQGRELEFRIPPKQLE